MAKTHNLGFPRVGAKRELKFGQEAYWKGQSSRDELKALGASLRLRHWKDQARWIWLRSAISRSTIRSST